ncbi:MAG: hypothetical protein RTU30_15100, partial [Candidatus Thorarchaeota archaeon]
TVNLIGSDGGPFQGTNYSYGSGDGSKAGGGIDWLRTMDASQGVIEFPSSGSDEYAATLSPYVNGLFFGFAFDSISNQSDRIDLMNRTLNYFGLYNPPQVSLLSPIADDLVRSPVTFTWDSSSDIISILYNPIYHVFVDGQRIVSDWSLETCQVAISEGIHTVRLVCQDDYGQRAYDTITIEVDSTAPQIEVVGHEEGSVLKSGSMLEFNFSDSHLQDIFARWDSDPWMPFPLPYDSFLPSGDGTHSFDINATDEAGNWNYTQFTFICDDTVPDISLVGILNGSILKGGSLIDLEINDTYFEIAMYHWDLYDDEEVPYVFETSLPSGDGPHNLYVNATDIAGNQRINHFQFIADDTAPTISLVGLTNGTILKTGSPINLGVNDTHPEIAMYHWDLDEDSFFEELQEVVYVPPLEGEHWLFVNATDEAGNSAFSKYMFVVDNTAPEVSVVSPVEGSSVLSGTQIMIDVFELHIDTVYFRWDTEDWIEWNDPYMTYAPVGDGYHALFVNATDVAGNWVQAVFVFITTDTGISSTTTTITTTVTTTTTQPTTSPSTSVTPTTPTIPSGPAVDLSTTLGLMGLGIGIGIGITLLIVQLLRRRKSPTS